MLAWASTVTFFLFLVIYISVSYTENMDFSYSLTVSLLLVSLLVVVSASSSEEQGREMVSRSSDVVHVERRPMMGSAQVSQLKFFGKFISICLGQL